MKAFLLLALPLFSVSCSELSTGETAPDPQPVAQTETPPAPVEEAPAPVADQNDGLDFAVPNTTGELLTEENKKTVTGPAPVNIPVPAQDSAIEVAPPTPAPSVD